MKRFFLPLLSLTLALASCGHQMTADEALQAYQDMQQQNTEFMKQLEQQSEVITTEDEYLALVQRADSAYNAFILQAYDLAKDFSGKEVCTQVLEEMHYYFDVQQKEVLFAKYTEEQIAESNVLSKIHKAFLAEKGTTVGNTYTDFSAPQPDGTALAVSELVGQSDYLLIDFWASWCSPCRQSMPSLKELYASLPDGRLQILGCSLDNNGEKWLDAIASLGLPWRHISDLKGWSCEGAALYGVSAIPATVLIDRQGTIVGRNLSYDELSEIINQ